MIDDNERNWKAEYNTVMAEMQGLRQKYEESEEDNNYLKSLLDAEFEKGIVLKKEIQRLRLQNNDLLKSNARVNLENDKLMKKLWEVEKRYVEDHNDNYIELGQDLKLLKQKFARGYWND